MRIAYLSQSTIPSNRANTVHVLKMCNALSRKGHEVVLYGIGKSDGLNACLSEYGLDSEFKARLWNIPSIPGNTMVLATLSFLDILFEKNFDLIYGRAVFSIFLCSFLNIPFGFESHAPPRTRFHQLAEKWIYKRKNFIYLVCISKRLKDWYHKNLYHKSSNQLIVAPDAADPLNQAVETKEPPKPDDQHSIKIGYAGSFYQGKGADFIVQLATRIPAFEFHLIGGPEEILRSTIKDQLIPDNVNIHGFLAHAAVQSQLLSFDILLAPYKNKVLPASGNFEIANWMSPLKVFEYMATGVPLIASNLPVLCEVLKDRHNCLLCTPEDTDQWVSSINALANNQTLRKKLGNQAKSDFNNNYTWDARACKLLSEFERAINANATYQG